MAGLLFPIVAMGNTLQSSDVKCMLTVTRQTITEIKKTNHQITNGGEGWGTYIKQLAERLQWTCQRVRDVLEGNLLQAPFLSYIMRIILGLRSRLKLFSKLYEQIQYSPKMIRTSFCVHKQSPSLRLEVRTERTLSQDLRNARISLQYSVGFSNHMILFALTS